MLINFFCIYTVENHMKTVTKLSNSTMKSGNFLKVTNNWNIGNFNAYAAKMSTE